MGIKSSPIPVICMTAGFIGIAVALYMQYWMSAVDYPVRIGGKPLISWPAFVPIVFELFVLFAALATMGSMLALCRLGKWHSPLHDTGVMHEVTSNRFALVLEARDEKFNEEKTAELLRQAGCQDVRPLVDEGAGEESR